MKASRNKRIFRIVLFTGTFISLFFVPWILVKAWILPLPDSVQGQLDQAIDHGFDGIVVCVNQADKAPALYAAGWHNLENKIPARPNALFKIASINKLFTAVAITKLSNSKRISLNKTLGDYLPELIGRIENADKITLKMMIQHRSGIPNYTNIPNYWAAPKESNRENLELILDTPASFEPDTDYEYSNTNYLLLAEIMDKVLGYDNFEFIQKEILNRLHLKNTFASVNHANLDDVMSGYHVGHPYDLKTDNVGMVATAQDLAVFIRALNDGSVFDEGEKEIYDAIYNYGHTGLVPGYQSIARYHKDIDAVVIQFTTPSNFEGYNWNLADIVYGRILKILRRNTD